MKRITLHIVPIALSVLMLLTVSCTTSKSLMKDGNEYHQAGMYEQAVRSFKASLSRNSNNVQSRTGLQAAAQKMLDTMLDDFTRSSMMGNDRDAVYYFRDGEQFQNELKKFDIKLNVPTHYVQDFARHKETFLSGLYDEGNHALDIEDFTGAKALFDEILTIDVNYRDVADLQDTAELEPKYRAGQDLLAQGEAREAYYVFSHILGANPNYKEARAFRTQSLEAGEFVMAMLPFENSSTQQGVEERVQAYTLNSLLALDNPFLKVVDRQHLEQVIQEQNFSLSGVINDATAIEVGNLTGAEAIMIGQIIDFNVVGGRTGRTTRNAYERYQVSVKQEDGSEKKETRYKKVTYTEYSTSNSVYISCLVKLLDLETSEVLISEVMESQLGDAVTWSRYDGNYKSLVPEKNDKPQTSRSAVNEFRSSFEARTNLVSTAELSAESYQDVARAISARINSHVR